MTCLPRALLAALWLSLPMAAFGQGAVLQSGPVTPGHVPQYVGTGSQAVVQDGGSSAGGGIGANPAEFGLTARGTGTPPYVGQGKGPLGTNWCDYDAPKTNATGYHYLCLGPNPGQMVFGAVGLAAPIPFSLIINGIAYTFPSSGVAGNVVTTVVPTTSGAPVCFTGTSGRVSACPAIPAATFTGNPTAGPISQAQNFTVQGLPPRGAPDANNDKIVLYNAATGALNYVTPGLIAASATSGVSSLGGVTGPITLGNNLVMTGSQLSAPLGGSNGQIQYNNGGVSGGFTASGDVTINPSTGATLIQPNAVTTAKIADGNVTNAKLAAGAANTFKGTLNGTATSDIALTACTLSYQITKWIAGTGWQCGLNPVLPSRAIAMTRDLSAFSAVTTQGYALPGDGGGSMFQQQAAGTPFKDTQIVTATITAGSGYTNGIYNGVALNSGHGTLCQGQMTIAGGVVTAFFTVAPCSGYAVGDVLGVVNSQVGGTGSGFAWTVTATSTAQGSFPDMAGNLFQYVTDQAAYPNVRQFGCKGDWAGNDAFATNDRPCLNSAIAFAYNPSPSSAALVVGTKINVPKGSYLLCGGNSTTGTVMLPQSVRLDGPMPYGGASLVQCAAEPSNTHFFILCDTVSGTGGGQFGCILSNIALKSEGVSNSSIAMVFSNSGQQFPLLDGVYMDAGQRSCFIYAIGRGGAANVISQNVDCESPGTTVNDGVVVDSTVGSTQFIMTNWIFGCTSSCSRNGLRVAGGNFVGEHIHFEQQNNGALFTNTLLSSLRDVTGGAGCTSLVTLSSPNPPNMTIFENLDPGSCVTTIINGHSGGSPITGLIKLPMLVP